MWKTFFGRFDRHFIYRGRVGCPVSGSDVDLDTCNACPALLETRAGDERPYIRCKPVRPDAMRVAWFESQCRPWTLQER